MPSPTMTKPHLLTELAASTETTKVVAAHLQPGDWAIDAGANVGLIAGPMAAAVPMSVALEALSQDWTIVCGSKVMNRI